MKKIAIIYLLWGDEPQRYLDRALVGIIAQTYSRDNLHLLVVYNPKEGIPSAVPFIRERLVATGNLPPATVLEQEKNLGFSGANNAGMRWAVEHEFDYAFLHNADGYLHPQAIEKLASVMQNDDKIGEVQALTLLYPETNLINSAGNSWHYLGVGFCRFFREPLAQHEFLPTEEIGYASGAAALMRCDLLKKHGYWNEDFFMYHEDTEYSLRLRMFGYKIILSSEAIFYHEYEFLKSVTKYYWLERNRYALNIVFYKWPTLILLLPLELVYDLGLLFLSWRNGWLKEYLAAWTYWFTRANWKIWLAHRHNIQAVRQVSDREFMCHTAMIISSGGLVASRLIVLVANVIFTVYYFLVRMLLWW
ncbi:MAG: glycosyltransferase family 2 protein [Candidatus Magasanikbacteria bacterium]